jgi:kumamolisin
MDFEKKVALTGSDRHVMPGSRITGEVHPDDNVTVSVVLRRRSGAGTTNTHAYEMLTGGASGAQNGATGGGLSHADLAAAHGANPDDISMVEQFAHEYGLTVVDASVAKRRVILTGTAHEMQSAFDAALKCYQIDDTGPTFRGRTGTLSVPEPLNNMIVAVLGMDNRPVAKPHFRANKRSSGPAGTFTPPQVAQLYNFPSGVNGAGQTIAMVELGGGYRSSDLKNYFKALGVKAPKVSAVGVDGAKNKPGSSADGEVLLDIEVAGAIANGANIAVYFAPNTDKGFVDAILDAAHDTTRKPSVISISWGAPEDSWTAQARAAMNQALQDCAALGITVTVAAGDDGSSDGVQDGSLHVDFPAASPYALACGGTTLAGSGSKIQSETVWNEIAKQEGATGGGISNAFPIPAYQASAGVPTNAQTKYAGRGVPDISGDADPSTGYQVLVDGQKQIVGGTSAVAPLWAALVAMLNQDLGKPVGFLNPTLYGLKQAVTNDITSGNNDDSGLGAYSAKSGWDACTGLGSPNGTALLNVLRSQAGSGSATKQAQPAATGVAAS